LGLTTALGGFLIGYDTGQLSNILQFKDFIDRFGNVDDDGTKGWQPTIQSLIVSFMSIGALIGALFGA
jgi:SP family sugar:H+ symporter-like MFS transporter